MERRTMYFTANWQTVRPSSGHEKGVSPLFYWGKRSLQWLGRLDSNQRPID